MLLFALFALGVFIEHAVLPIMEGGDEYLHYNYVQFLLRENRLPDRSTFLTNSMGQQSGQPPLAYWTGAMLMRLANLPPDDDQAFIQRFNGNLKNAWYAAPDPWNRVDNRNLFLHGGDDQAIETPTLTQTDDVIRFTGLIYGLVALIAAYAAGWEVFRRESWALVTAALFAFTPQMIHLSSFINTDAPMIAFAALATWMTLRLLRLGATPRRCLLIGLFLALAGLSKVSGLLVAPAVGLALLFDGNRRQLSFGRILVNGLLVSLPLLLLFGPWMLYGWTNFNDPFGLNTHLRPGYFNENILSLAQIIPFVPELYLGYWGKLASAIYLHPVTYSALGTLLVLSLIGFACWIARRPAISLRHVPTQQGMVLAVIILFGIAGLIHWVQTIDFITGRLMFQAHLAVMLVLTGGLYQLAKRFPHWKRALQTYTTGLIVTAGLLLTPISIYTAFAPPPMLQRAQLPALSGSPVDFDHTIRFLGYTQGSPLLTGNLHTIQLCWEVLTPAARPAAFSVKFVHDGKIIADRTSLHGLGRYDSGQWKAGDIWCDRVDVPITTAPEPGQTYDVLLVLLDAHTQAVDWQATTPDGTPIQYPFIAQVTAP
jgi:4-amino-4-deoxy-L-arabinose transferase-like glycosyltransferase